MGLDIIKAQGDLIIDRSGKEYIDFISGIGVSNLGHNLPEIKEAIRRQLDKHAHVMVYGEYEQEVVTEFAHTLLSFFPDRLNAMYPVNSGTEANEAALKLARRVTGRSEIISFQGAYHGNTTGSMSISYNEDRKYPFRPLLPDVRFIALNNSDQLNQITDKTAAVFLETIQGDAGVRIPTVEYMQALLKKCRSTGTLLILDEVQVGMGRTGKFSAFEHFDIVPDVVTLGKALGAGMPIGAVVSQKKYLDQLSRSPELGHITTFGGHPVICASGLAGLRYFKEHRILDQVEEKGRFIENALTQIPGVQLRAFRRKGMMIAVELDNPEQVNQVINACRESGVLLFWFLSLRNGFRIAPPLNISTQNLEKACQIIRRELIRANS
ncbi:aspartate aminotransferase family protein [bacterium SCSIO 12741]|nr:aspartate aminotransferase family protein [bacterium SCSIO 12741]